MRKEERQKEREEEKGAEGKGCAKCRKIQNKWHKNIEQQCAAWGGRNQRTAGIERQQQQKDKKKDKQGAGITT